MISTLHSIKAVERQYSTGEEPVLVLCSDKVEYICKYARSNGAAFKLVSELIGSQLALLWGLKTPSAAFVNIRPSHWIKAGNTGILAFGSRRLDKVIDVNNTTIGSIKSSENILFDILDIALFDLWVANEDRNANNANLMYDINLGAIISIDYGCIFNTAMYDYPMSQLTSTDTILASDLFYGIQKDYPVDKVATKVMRNYNQNIARCQQFINKIVMELPSQWNISTDAVQSKVAQLFDSKWCDSVLNNFKEYLSENITK